MKNKLPCIIEEGIRNIAICGFESIYEEIIEEYAEKLKQDFISQMKQKMKVHTETRIQQSLSYLNDEELIIKVEIDVKGVEWK